MKPLDYREIAELLNHSRTTRFELEPTSARENAWSVYQGEHRISTSVYPFQILYLSSRASKLDLETATKSLDWRVETHVVYPPSMRVARAVIQESLPRAESIWTTWEYLRSFIKDELQTYVEKVSSNPPRYYIDPPVEVPAGFHRRFPNPLLSFFLDRGEGIPEGSLGILLAEPGQGKTYMSRYLVTELAKRKYVPLLIDSSQWQTLPFEDQKSIWKTIVHSLRHYDAPIGWLEGHESDFLRATLKTDFFRTIFDGFDEYILQTKGSVQPLDVLESLAKLAKETGARIIITSRTSFWETNIAEEDTQDFIARTGSYLYKILPFSREHANNYFKVRFQEAGQVEAADRLYRRLYDENKELVGRGFVLSLIADLIERAGRDEQSPPEATGGILWLMQALCERDQLRQRLPLTGQEQMSLFRAFAAEGAMGEEMGSELLDLAVQLVKPEMDAATRGSCLEKFKSHPLIGFDRASSLWRYREEQIGNILLADYLVSATTDALAHFVDRARLVASRRHDLSEMIVGLITSSMPEPAAVQRLAGLVAGIRGKNVERSPEGGRLAATIVSMAVEKFRPRGSSHKDRSALFLELFGGSPVSFGHFSGTLAGFDFQGIEFAGCSFDRVVWANCEFNEKTTFRRSTFVNGGAAPKSVGLGSAQLIECVLDEEAAALFNTARVKEGKRKYTAEDAKNDIQWIITKFVKGGAGIKSVEEGNILKGPVAESRHKREALDALLGTAIDEHIISGPSSRGYHVREEAVEAVKFYAANNVMTGALYEAYQKLLKKVGLA